MTTASEQGTTDLESGLTGATATRRLRAVAPSRDEAIDAVVALLLSGIAVVGLDQIYDAPRALVVALYAAVVGVVLGIVGARLRLGATATALVTGAVFLLAAGPAAPETALAGVLPGLDTPSAVVEGVIRSWLDVLTTQPPIALVGSAAVLPYLLGFVAGGGAMVLARRTRTAALPALPPLLAMVATIFVGRGQPFSVVLQGGAFFVVAVVWGSLRADRDRREQRGPVNWPRLAGGAVMVVVVVATALVVGGRAPATTGERFVARDEVVPPFDPRDYPSPLASFPTHRTERGEERVLFTAEGLEEGQLVRLAVMDDHDGVVWVVGGDDSVRYVRIGREVVDPEPIPGDAPPVDVELTVEGYRGVWLPTVGAVRSLRFGGPRSVELGDALRYNGETRTAGTSLPLTEGDVVLLDGRLLSFAEHRPEPGEDEDLVSAGVIDQRLPALPASDPIGRRALEEVGDAGSAYAVAVALESWLQEGGNSDLAPEEDEVKNPGGHSLLRLEEFLARPEAAPGEEAPPVAQLVGNDEQYAATMAYAARTLGLPARVVLGLDPEDPSRMTGADVTAWVEIPFEGHGWVPFFPTPDQAPQEQPERAPNTEPLAQQEPPPDTYVRPPLTAPDLRPRTDEELTEPLVPEAVRDVLRLVLRALVVLSPVLVPVALILGAKALRRRRRRTRGTPVDRITGAWAELIDAARDRGATLPRHSTRQEVAAALPSEVWSGAGPMAAHVDGLMFGPATPTDQTAEALWSLVEAQRREIRRGVGRVGRVRAALSLASFRRLR